MTIGSDAVIEEIRKSRLRMSERCGHDPAKYIRYLKRFNRKYSAQVKNFRERAGKPTAS